MSFAPETKCVNCNETVSMFALMCPHCGKDPNTKQYEATFFTPSYVNSSIDLNTMLQRKDPEEIEKESKKLKQRIKYLEEKSEKRVSDLEHGLDASQKQVLKMKNALKKLESVYEKESKTFLTKDEKDHPYMIDAKSALYDKLISRLKKIRKIK